MNLFLFQSRSGRSAAVFTLLASFLPVRSEPFVPSDGNVVLERLPRSHADDAANRLRHLQARLARGPRDPDLAAEVARRCIERNRLTGDPRFLGQAQAALIPWWDISAPPVSLLVLRATVKQSWHEFEEALADLDVVVRLAPNQTQAWLTRATILTVLGRYDEARRSCLPLLRLAPELVAVTAAANIAGLTGQAEHACDLLRQTLRRNEAARPAERVWAWTVLAETAARIGHAPDAEKHFRSAMAIQTPDPYLLSAYADFLLDEGRAGEVAALLKDAPASDALLLRLTLAEARQGTAAGHLREHQDLLHEQFGTSRRRGETPHQREEARFTLHVRHEPEAALRLAAANWEVQREPADIRILLECALEARRGAEALPAIHFVRTHRLEDRRIQHLVAALENLGISATYE